MILWRLSPGLRVWIFVLQLGSLETIEFKNGGFEFNCFKCFNHFQQQRNKGKIFKQTYFCIIFDVRC